MLNQEDNQKIIEALTTFISSTDYNCGVDDVYRLALQRKAELEKYTYWWSYELEDGQEYDEFSTRAEAYSHAEEKLLEREHDNMRNVSEYYTFREEVILRNYCKADGDAVEIFKDSETISFDKRDYGF